MSGTHGTIGRLSTCSSRSGRIGRGQMAQLWQGGSQPTKGAAGCHAPDCSKTTLNARPLFSGCKPRARTQHCAAAACSPTLTSL